MGHRVSPVRDARITKMHQGRLARGLYLEITITFYCSCIALHCALNALTYTANEMIKHCRKCRLRILTWTWDTWGKFIHCAVHGGKLGPLCYIVLDSNKYPLVIITMMNKDRSNLILPNLKVQCRHSDMVNGWHL